MDDILSKCDHSIKATEKYFAVAFYASVIFEK